MSSSATPTKMAAVARPWRIASRARASSESRHANKEP